MYRYSTTNMSIHLFSSTGATFNNWTTWYTSTGYVSDNVISLDTFRINGTSKSGIVTEYSYFYDAPHLHYFQPINNVI